MTDAAKVYSLDITTSKEFTISEGQTLICVAVEYTNPKNMSVTIKETGYATLYTDYAVTIPAGVNAYTAKLNDAKDAINLTEVTTTIPKNTGVILHTDAPGTYSFVAAADVDAISGNDLIGATTETVVAANSVYTLGLGSDGETVGMNLYKGTSIRAYSAYMNAPAGARGFIGFDEATAINQIEVQKQQNDGVYYNLAGQRVAQPTKGLYIVNGKKVIIK